MMYNVKKFDDLDMGTQVVVRDVYTGKCFEMDSDRIITKSPVGVCIMNLMGKVLGLVQFDDIEKHLVRVEE